MTPPPMRYLVKGEATSNNEHTTWTCLSFDTHDKAQEFCSLINELNRIVELKLRWYNEYVHRQIFEDAVPMNIRERIIQIYQWCGYEDCYEYKEIIIKETFPQSLMRFIYDFADLDDMSQGFLIEAVEVYKNEFD